MTVKILHKIFLLLLLATFMLTSCHDDDEPIDEPTEQTVIFFMPWSTNMTPYFEQNIVDFETAIKGGLLKNERVIVCISSTTSRANVIELRQEQNRCVRDTLMFYNQPDFTQRENISRMLNDVRAIAPARRCSAKTSRGCSMMCGPLPQPAVTRSSWAVTVWAGFPSARAGHGANTTSSEMMCRRRGGSAVGRANIRLRPRRWPMPSVTQGCGWSTSCSTTASCHPSKPPTTSKM